MIFRRRHTSNFTTIGNALFDDDRLAADELGILAWLLSRPHDWEVRRPALMRRHHVGRDALKRIITNWMRTGWCHAQKTRLSNGTFHIVYEIRDQPGRELSDDEIRMALSLVSSEAVDGDAEVNDAAGSQNTGDPPTPKPGVDDQHVAGRNWPIESLENPDSVRTEPTKGVRAFADVKAGWPADHVLSEVACETLHLGLTDPLKEAAFQGIRAYLDDCRAQSRKVCDLATYYRERRWERFANRASTSTLFVVKRGTPQAMRWRDYFAVNDPSKLVMFDRLVLHGSGYTVPSEWPPPASRPAAPASGALSEADSHAVQNF